MTATPAEAPLVLVVDDDPDMRDLLRAALTGADMRVIALTGGEEALAVLGGVRPDLILLDAVMPAPDGFETCRRIRQRMELAATPVMFMTGLTESEHVVAGFRAGGVDYVTKPPLLAELVARVRAHIATGRMTRSAQHALDIAGRRLLATDAAGAVTWSTPQAARLLAELGLAADDGAIGARLAQMVREGADEALLDCGGQAQVRIQRVAHLAGEHLFRIHRQIEGMEAAVLREQLDLTARESDVLRWVAAGKPNKDVGEILNISARTVNKHLDQIFVKLGVENRAAAAAIAARVLATAL